MNTFYSKDCISNIAGKGENVNNSALTYMCIQLEAEEM